MTRNLLKKVVSILIAICITLGFAAQPVFGISLRDAGDSGVMRMYDRTIAGYKFGDNFPAPYAGAVSRDDGTKWSELRMMNGGQPYSAYCIQLGIGIHTGDRFSAQDTYDELPTATKIMINHVLMFGFDFGRDGENPTKYFATQVLIWQIEYDTVNTDWEQPINDVFFARIPEGQAYYNELKQKVFSYKTVPSFCGTINLNAPTHELNYDKETRHYTTTLTDSNDVLGSFHFVYDGINMNPVGNVLSIDTASNLSDTVTIRAEKVLPSDTRACAVDYWIGDTGVQHVVTPNYNRGADPVTAVFKLKISSGNIEIVKQSEDNIVDGIEFKVVGNGIDRIVTTQQDGRILESLPAGNYTITETTPDKYVEPESQFVTIYGGQTTSITFANRLKKFRIEGRKIDTKYATSTSRFNQEYPPQGDASLDGAVYGLYHNGELIEKMVTANGGKFESQYYPCGYDWYVKEISSSPGYLLNDEEYYINAEPGSYELEYNAVSPTCTEQIIQGSIAITKHTDDPDLEGNGSNQIEKPEKNAQFQVYLKSAGSYEAAKETERDLLVTSASGQAQSVPLPFGIYTVHQISGLEGHKLVPDFDVYICEDQRIYSFILSNPIYQSLVEIVKLDAETGKIIPISGTGFKVKDMSTGKYITQHINYPTPTDIDVFYTDSTGKLMLPEKLKFGKFQLIEEKAPNGYVLNGEPVNFEVDGTEEKITVTMKNTPVKGTISILKSGEYLTGSDFRLTKYGKMYSPVYEIGNQPGAVYDIIAATDIITPDGTIRAKQGEVVDTVTTTNSGATTKELYLGGYIVKEVRAPIGMVISTDEQRITLSYAGQSVPIVETSTSFVNERQKVSASLKKVLEQDEIFLLGTNEEYKRVTFGLFVREDIKTIDGSIALKKDCLIEISGISEDGSLVFQSDLPIGKYYIKELFTDNHYTISNKEYDFSFEYQGQDIPVVRIDVNGMEPIENRLIRGDIYGRKVNQDGFGLAGATIGLFLEHNLNNPILTTEVNEIGYFEFLNVPYGTFYIKELKSPIGFILSDKLYKVVVSSNDQIVEIEIENQLIQGNVEVTKVDEEFPDNKLTGAAFEVIVDIDHNGIYDSEIDKQQAGFLQEVTEGVYRLSGLPYGYYFLHELSSPEGFLHDDNYYPFAITEDGKTVTVENQAGVGFINTPITGIVEITKTDINTGEPLPNTGIEIIDEQGNIIVQGRTSESGVIRFNLRYGKFYYREYDAPDGYIIDENKYPFEIRENGVIVKCQMTNTAKIGEVIFKNPNKKPDDYSKMYTPKTGDNSSFLFVVLLLSLSGITAIVATTYRRHKKSRNGVNRK